MDIIIVGDGKVGYTLAEQLSQEEHNVTIVDTSDEALRKADEALEELKQKTAQRQLTASTRNLTCGVDYNIGDRVRVQNGNETVVKMITAVEFSNENNQINEKPIMNDWNEVSE